MVDDLAFTENHPVQSKAVSALVNKRNHSLFLELRKVIGLKQISKNFVRLRLIWLTRSSCNINSLMRDSLHEVGRDFIA